MRRISWHIKLIATSTIAILAAQTTVAAVSWGATATPKVSLNAASKAQLNKEIQEYVAKNKGKGAAAGEALSKLTKSPEEAAATTPTTASASSTSGSSTGSILLIAGIAALVLLGGIVLYIYRDTRRVAPVTTSGPVGTAATPNAAARQRRRRAKAKAARQQRKRNR
jgi:hypothetical protein